METVLETAILLFFCFKQFDNSKELITPVENSDNRQNLKTIKRILCLPATREATDPSVPSVKVEVITLQVFRSPMWLAIHYGMSVLQMTTDIFPLQ